MRPTDGHFCSNTKLCTFPMLRDVTTSGSIPRQVHSYCAWGRRARGGGAPLHPGLAHLASGSWFQNISNYFEREPAIPPH